jgi:hypothetical protein
VSVTCFGESYMCVYLNLSGSIFEAKPYPNYFRLSQLHAFVIVPYIFNRVLLFVLFGKIE